jgi:nitroreductase
VELYEAMTTGGSPRAFLPDPVDRAILYKILERARFAPSGGNQQGWRVIVVDDPETRRALRDLYQVGWREYANLRDAGTVPFAAGEDGVVRLDTEAHEQARRTPAPNGFADNLDRAPVLLILAMDLRSLSFLDVELGRPSMVGGGSAYPFAQNIILAARAEGLGGIVTTIICREEEAVRRLLGVPASHAIAGMLALGRPSKQVTKLTRRPVEAFATFDRFDGRPFTRDDRTAGQS